MEFDVLRTRVSHHLATGRAAQAVDLLKDHLQEHQEKPEFWVYYASALLSLHRYADAESAARAALNLSTEQPQAGKVLAVALMRQERRDEALQTVYWLINDWPEFAYAHYLLGMILISSARSAEDRKLARQATEHALELEPEDPDYYQGAALAAQLSGDHRAALEYLRAGLSIDPNHQGMLRFAAETKNGEKLVGDRGQLLRGLLASDPMNEGLHEDFAETFVEKQGVYRNRFWVFIPLLACLASFGALAEGGARFIFPALIAAVSGGFALWNMKSYKSSIKPLPAGYIDDLRSKNRWVFRALRFYQGSWAAGLAGALLACFEATRLAGVLLLLLGVTGSQLAGSWIGREIAGVPQDPHDSKARRLFLLRRSGALASGFWLRVLLVVVNLVLLGLCAAGDARLASVPLAAVGIGLLAVAIPLIAAQIHLGFSGNAFAYGLALDSSSKHRTGALIRGNVGAIYYIGVHLVFGLIATAVAIVLLIGGPDEFESTDPPATEHEWSEQEIKQLKDSLNQSPTPGGQLPSLPSFPTLDLP